MNPPLAILILHPLLEHLDPSARPVQLLLQPLLFVEQGLAFDLLAMQLARQISNVMT